MTPFTVVTVGAGSFMMWNCSSVSPSGASNLTVTNISAVSSRRDLSSPSVSSPNTALSLYFLRTRSISRSPCVL